MIELDGHPADMVSEDSCTHNGRISHDWVCFSIVLGHLLGIECTMLFASVSMAMVKQEQQT
jgi:hypothetical protein